MKARVYVNVERTVLVEVWDDGTVTVATRTHPGNVWGPPITVTEQR